MSGESTVRVGVFATDPGMRVVQGYTTDRALVRQAVAQVHAVRHVGRGAEGGALGRAADTPRERQLVGESDAAAARVDRRRRRAGAQRLGESASVRTSCADPDRAEHAAVVRQSRSRAQGLRHVAGAARGGASRWRTIPGRKTIVFFSEGLPVSPSLSARLDSVIDAANRANVTAYAVDAKGLRAKSTLETARKEIDVLRRGAADQSATGRDRTEQPLTMAFERVEDTIKLDSRAGLARLADDTGGFLVEEIEQPLVGVPPHRRGQPVPLPADLFAEERHARRQVPRDPGQGRPAGHAGLRAQGIPRDPRAAGRRCRAATRPPRWRCSIARRCRTRFPIQAAGFSFPDPARPGLTPVARARLDRVRCASTWIASDPRIRDAGGRGRAAFATGRGTKCRRSASNTC